MSTETELEDLDLPFASPPKEDPYYYGWRYVTPTDEHGKPILDEHGEPICEQVPLTEWDALHPEEDDFLVETTAHQVDVRYLHETFEDLLRGRGGVMVFSDHRVNWQREDEYAVFGPDVVVFDHVTQPWDRHRGTFPVRTMGARAVVAVEIVSENTERNDKLRKRLAYHRIGIPLYILVDRVEIDGTTTVTVSGFRAAPKRYQRIPADPRGVWIPFLKVWIRSAGDRVACFDEQENRIPDRAEQRDQAQEGRIQEKQRADQEADQARLEKERAEQERQRADQEKERAEQERQRAEKEKQRAEKEKQRAEKEKTQARREKERAEQEKERAEQERQRADQEKLRAEAAELRETQIRQEAELEKQRALEAARKLAELEAELRRLRGEA